MPISREWPTTLSVKPDNPPPALDDLRIVQAVARHQGFRAASSALGLSPSRVSDAVRRFEDRVGLRLFERSTRRVRPTATLDALLAEVGWPLA